MNLDNGDTRLLIVECKKQNALRNQAAYILATCHLETGYTMKPVEEAWWVEVKHPGWRQRNLKYWPWHGRGHTQITHERNYSKMEKRLGVDLTSDPKVVMHTHISVQIAVIGALEGLFTGKKLSDYITLRSSDFVGARRVINGTDRANLIAEYAREFDQLLLEENYGVDTIHPDWSEHKDPIPVVNSKRDGTLPRASKLKSKTLWSQVSSWAASYGAIAYAAYKEQETAIQYFLLGAAVVVTLTGIVIFKERIKKWAEGDR